MALTDSISGLGKNIKDIFVPRKEIRSFGPKPPKKVDLSKKAVDRIRELIVKYYREGSYEKIPLARKWMRNSLLFQGYQDLDVNEDSGAINAAVDDYADLGFPNNYYRSTIKFGVSLYLKTPPQLNFAPTAEDPDGHFICDASKKALPIICKNVGYDRIRALEALHQRLYGNSFRYSYFSLDPRFGKTLVPITEDVPVQVGEDEMGQPVTVNVPQPVGAIEYPRGQEMVEIVHPLEINVRSSSSMEAGGIRITPYLVRARMVDLRQLQASYPDIEIKGGGDRHSEDLAVHYKESLSEMMGDTVDPVSWYASATKEGGTLFLQGWLRPSLYWDDEELSKKFPDGLYGEVCGKSVLSTRNESMDDHWTHMPYCIVPGRFWGDGDDDLVPQQLSLNTVDQMITQNIAYNSVPKTYVPKGSGIKDQIDNNPSAVHEVDLTGGRSIRDAVMTDQGKNLSSEVYLRRNQILTDFQYHSQVFGSAIGLHQEGVNTMGGQMQFAARTEANLTPIQLVYKEANEQWVRQMLKIAAENWIDERVNAVMGLNGRYEFSKLRGAALDPDRVIIDARIIPTDYAEQQNFVQAVAGGVLDATDPRVRRKALDYFNMPSELDREAMDAKVQWKEIEQMTQGVEVPARPFADNHNAHIDVIRCWLNTDVGMEAPPEIQQIVYNHMLQHVQAQFIEQQMMMGIANAAMGGGEGGSPVHGPSPDKQTRTQRAMKGAAAKPNQPQPSEGNQNG